MPVRIVENCQGISVCLYTTTSTNGTRLELAAAEHNDVPVDHRHAEALFPRFAVRLDVGI